MLASSTGDVVKRMAVGRRELIVSTVEGLSGLPLPKVDFAVLFSTGESEPTSAERAFVEALATSRCREMCFAGKNAERFHDLADDVVEARGLLEIVTTWLSNETADEVAFYFVTVAGAAPPLLLALVEEQGALERALEVGFSAPQE
jgi:hypothetical protein